MIESVLNTSETFERCVLDSANFHWFSRTKHFPGTSVDKSTNKFLEVDQGSEK